MSESDSSRSSKAQRVYSSESDSSSDSDEDINFRPNKSVKANRTNTRDPLSPSKNTTNMAQSDKQKAKVYREHMVAAGFKFDKQGQPIPPDTQTGSSSNDENAPRPPKKARTSDTQAAEIEASASKSGAVHPSKAMKALAEQLAITDKKTGKDTAGKEMAKLIERTVKEDIWRVVKFQNTPNERRNATKLCLNALNMPGFKADNPDDAKRREDWIRAYESTVCKCLNSLRNYVQSQIMNEAGYPWIRHADNKEGKLPSEDRMKALNVRDLDPENKEDYELWKWWQTKAIPKASGHRKGWDRNKFCYLTMGRGAPPNAPKKLHVPPSTEAIAQAMIDNSRSKWENTAVLMKEPNHP